MPRSDADFDEPDPNRTPPNTLYQYMSVQIARDILHSGKLRYSSPLNFNDPFDAQWDLFWPMYTEESQAKFGEIIERAMCDRNSWPPGMNPEWSKELAQTRRFVSSHHGAEKQAVLTSLINDLVSPKRRRAATESARDQMIKSKRILCLCGIETSTLMWSHYASKHRGVVLGFDPGRIEGEVHQVEYVEKLPVLINPVAFFRRVFFRLEDGGFDGEQWKWLITKHEHWEYEKEWRYIREDTIAERMFVDIEYPPEALTEIVSGYRTDPADFDYLLHLARKINPDIKCSRMSPHESGFKLVKSPYEPTAP